MGDKKQRNYILYLLSICIIFVLYYIFLIYLHMKTADMQIQGWWYLILIFWGLFVSGALVALIYFIPILGTAKKPSRALGKRMHIRNEKIADEEFEDKGGIDLLTGLYHRDAGISRIVKFMEENSPHFVCGIMILDMDDFERINIEEGKEFADAVLQSTADILRSMTGPEDILVRLGGDEFMIFLKNCNHACIRVVGKEILASIQNLSILGRTGVRISASAGTCVTEAGTGYSELYRCAESALRYVIDECKGTVACYWDICSKLGTELTQAYPDHYLISAIDSSSDYNPHSIITFAIELLGRASNLNLAIDSILARMGQMFRADRIFIFKIYQEYHSGTVVYQWARNGLDKFSQKRIYLSLEGLQALRSAYTNNRVCDKYITGKPSGPASCIHTPILDRGALEGAIFVEVWQEQYIWSEKEKRILDELTKVISSFLLKAQADAVSAAKEEFLSCMSHEIRTPMNAITGMTSIAKSLLDNPEKLLECLNNIELANKHLMELVNDVLSMSKIESGKVELHYEPVDLAIMIDELETLMRPSVEEKKMIFTVENGYMEKRPILVSPLHLNQVLINIIGNARNFTPEGGNIIFSVKPLIIGKETITLYFSVKDTGIGIAAEDMERIFLSFEQVRQNTISTFGGTGLGLAIASRLVQIMGGKLEVESQVGEGSHFFFNLEFSFAPEKGAFGTQENEDNSSNEETDHLLQDLKGKRVLLVEDNLLNCEIAQALLEMNGLEIETAENGLKAVEAFSTHEPNYYDGILMDIRMPVMDGLEATRRIRTMVRNDARTIPIIAMTANAFEGDSKKSLEAGMNGHLSKPIEINKVLEVLRSTINNKN